MWRSRTDRGVVREGNNRSFVSLHRRRGVLSLGVVLHLFKSGSDCAGVVAEAWAVVPEVVVLRMVFVRVSDSALLFRIDFMSEGTMQVCDLLKVSLSVVLSVELER